MAPDDVGRAPGSGIGRLRTYWRPIAVVVLAVPLAGYAIACSLRWFEAPFPGFFLMQNAVVPAIGTMEWPPDSGTVFHSRVVAVDGVPVDGSRDVYAYVARFPAGRSFDYTLEKDGRQIRKTIASIAFSAGDYVQTCGIMLGFGSLSLVMAVLVGFLQPSTLQARVYLLQGTVAAFPIAGIFLHQPGFPLLSSLCLVLECLLPATFIHLALVFPAERFRGRWRPLLCLPYVVSGVVAVPVLRGLFLEPRSMSAALYPHYLYIALGIAFFIAALFYGYWENPEPLARPRVKVILPGLILGTPVVLYGFFNNALFGGDFPLQLGLVLPVLSYASVAYAIARHNLFDVDRLVRLSFVYGALTIVVMSGYALVVALPQWLFPSIAGHQTLLGGAFVALVAMGLDPLRRGIQAVIDRAFYRTRLQYPATISALSEALTTLLDVREVVTQVTGVLTDAMQVECAALCLLPTDADRGAQWVRRHSVQEEPPDPCLVDVAGVFRANPHTFQAEAICAGVEAKDRRHLVEGFFARLGGTIAVPLLLRGEPEGLLVIGHKRSGRSLGSDDVELLRTLANQTAIAIQNARSYQALTELNRDLDEKVRQRTEELRASHTQLRQAYDELRDTQAQLLQSEKMASLGELVAGVAHELNNPASLVHGSLANLTDYVGAFAEVLYAYERAPIGDRAAAEALAALRGEKRIDFLLRETPELLRICAEGSDRVKRIIEDLRIFARADRGERAPMDVIEALESTIRLLGPRLRAGGVVIAKDYADVPHIDADAGLLNRVWMNVLTNALDAVEGRPDPAIRVRVRCRNGSGDGRDDSIEVEVQDNGGGIEPRHRERIFEPFFTTKPVGRGTGLGLSLVYGAIKSHGGTIQVDSEVGRGTSIAVRLPVRRTGETSGGGS